MKSKRFGLGSYSFALGLIALAGVILFNLLVGALPSTLTKRDLSEQSLFTLDEQTKTIVSSLKEPVKLYLIAEAGQEDTTLLQLLERYGELSDHLQVETVDPVVHPQFVSGYTKLQINPNSIIVESEKRHRVVDYTEIYTITSEEYLEYYYTYGQYVPDTFEGEDALTGAINYVTTDVLPVVGVLSGHGELPLSESVVHRMETDNLQVETTQILKTGISEDCSLLLINSPSSDISQEELSALKEFLSKGKAVFLLSDVGTKSLPHLDSLAAEFGLSRQTGAVAEEDATNYYLSPFYLFPQMESHEITDPLLQAGYSVYLAGAHPIISAEKEGITHSLLLQSSESSYSETESENKEAEKSEEDLPGPHALGILSENSKEKSAFLWISSSSLTEEAIDQMSAGANLSLFLNAAEALCGKTDTISIRTASLATDYLSISQGEVSLWTAVFCAVIPVSILASGIAVWWKRRVR